MTVRTARALSPIGATISVRARFVGAACALGLLVNSAPSKPKEAEIQVGQSEGEEVILPPQPRYLGGLEVGLSGPPVVGPDGGWWLLGRDGEVERFGPDDSLKWSISIAASITGEAATDESGQLLFIPTARDLVVALDRNARVHWKYKAPAGIVGSVCWVPKLGLVFVGRDRLLYWIDEHANLVLRSPVKSRVSVGPTPFGDQVMLGTDDGQVMAFSRQGKRRFLTLDAPVSAIITLGGSGAYVLAGGVIRFLDANLSESWTKSGALAIGVTAARGRESRQALVALSATGELEWFKSEGTVSVRSKPSVSVPCVPELVATSSAAWVADAAGTLWQARQGVGWDQIRIGSTPLLRPVLDSPRGRVLVGSETGSVWSLQVGIRPQ